jgi:uncharacterized protein Yka (UPF0111/DUF47 family)
MKQFFFLIKKLNMYPTITYLSLVKKTSNFFHNVDSISIKGWKKLFQEHETKKLCIKKLDM